MENSIHIVPVVLAVWGKRGRLLPLYPNAIFRSFANYLAVKRSLPAGLEKILFAKMTHLLNGKLKGEKDHFGLIQLREERKQNKRNSS